jgi:hypothetical protein
VLPSASSRYSVQELTIDVVSETERRRSLAHPSRNRLALRCRAQRGSGGRRGPQLQGRISQRVTPRPGSACWICQQRKALSVVPIHADRPRGRLGRWLGGIATLWIVLAVIGDLLNHSWIAYVVGIIPIGIFILTAVWRRRSGIGTWTLMSTVVALVTRIRPSPEGLVRKDEVPPSPQHDSSSQESFDSLARRLHAEVQHPSEPE